MLSYDAEHFVFQVAIQTIKGQDIWNYNFVCCLYGYETWSLTLREERKLRVFENMVLRRIFGSRSDEVTGNGGDCINEELNDLNTSTKTVRVIKSRRMRWAGHVARMGAERGCIGSWWGNRRERDHLGDLGVDGWIILG